MTKAQAEMAFLELSAQLKNEGLLEKEGAVQVALRGESGEVFFFELDDAGIAMQESCLGIKDVPLLHAFAVKPEAKTLLLLRGTYAPMIAQSLRALTAELDDMAQIVGLTARVANALSPKEIARCLRARNSCFVKGAGMLITGRSVSEAVTGAILLEKAAMTHILAKKIGGAKRVPLFSAALMHFIYQKKYSKINLGAEAEKVQATPVAKAVQLAQTAQERDLRAQIVAYGRQLQEEGLLQGTWGNLAVRLDETYMLCTPSGLDYRLLTPDDIVKVTLFTLDYGAQRKPTSEKRLHRDIFTARADVGAVIHTHAKICGVFAAARKSICCIEGEMKRLIGEEMRCAGHALPSTRKLSKVALGALGNRNGCLLMNHGVICCGTDLERAYLACKAAEAAAGQQLGL
ncbi:MAG: class II aldolase/adducin family protein [Eubacteriales bacterium]|jgi:L-fuculose-phosphate aldolase|nr:class II aldolase/adducin family protein [Eubacteriales bacterium]